MALTYSSMMALGARAPDFSLIEPLTGKTRTLNEVAGKKATVVVFWCNHCPYVKHVRDGFLALTSEYLAKGVGFVAISANDPKAYPDDAPEQMAIEAARLAYPFPYLHDATQEVALAYGATCTPDFFVYDDKLTLRYRGQLDGSRPGTGVAVTGSDLRAALDALLRGQPPAEMQTASCGCNIKWRAREPD
jgi:peroxiredoxin